jgi:transposase
MFYYSRDRGGDHPARHLASYAGILQADAYGGYNKLYQADRQPGPIVEATCWAHHGPPLERKAKIRRLWQITVVCSHPFGLVSRRIGRRP